MSFRYLGNIYQIVGDYEQAKKYLEKSLELAK
ncbi:MAG: tetratricopeptide repeat protein [Moorea sp. SIO2B7]|nr:tetratricopeptide repeat protein [Moorena sp. SIO2B7]